MVTFKIAEKEQTENEVLTLSLGKDEDAIVLIATDEDGVEWYILEFLQNGKIRRCSNVSDILGLEVDEDGHILIDDE